MMRRILCTIEESCRRTETYRGKEGVINYQPGASLSLKTSGRPLPPFVVLHTASRTMRAHAIRDTFVLSCLMSSVPWSCRMVS